MTLCIAATCQLNKNPTIIHCTDRRADLGYAGSADNLPKMKEIGKSWMLSMASSNWTVSDHLVGHIQGCFLAASQAPKQVDELKKLISDGIAAFSNSGEYKNADTELLVSGYLDATIPTIINVTLNGKKSALSIIGEFAGSIGHGQYIAKVFLAQREYSVYDDLETALYKIYEAKKYGERDSSVGPETSLAIQYRPTSPSERTHWIKIDGEGLKYLEGIRSICGLKPIPTIGSLGRFVISPYESN